MKIQILGSGCTSCKNLFENTKKIVSEQNLKAEVEYITGDKGIKKIIELGVMVSPVLVVNGNIIMTGSTSNMELLKEKILNSIESI